MLLITTFVKLRVVPERSRTRAGRPHAVSGRQMLIRICHAHAAPMPRCAMALRSRFQNGMVVAWARHGMCESNTAVLCKSSGKDTISTFSCAAWQENGMVCVNYHLLDSSGIRHVVVSEGSEKSARCQRGQSSAANCASDNEHTHTHTHTNTQTHKHTHTHTLNSSYTDQT
jgi:hypothetical protein